MPTRRSSRGRPSLNPATDTNPNNGISTRQPRITPRNSDVEEAIAAIPKETPYGTLRQLANIPQKPTTPLRRASSAGPPSTHRSARRTPVVRTPGGATQRLVGSGKKPNAVTPYGRAATREVEARRAGLTPGKDRRRSGRQQRETPRDPLRALSRILAPKSFPIVPTPQGTGITAKIGLPLNDDEDDGSDPERPRLSLPLGEDDEDDSLLLPPRSTGLEDENFTVQSVELPRRAISEQPTGRFSRGSFGSIRLSDQFADLNELGLDGVDRNLIDSSFMEPGGFVDDDNIPDITDIASQGDNTETLRGRISLASGRNSDIRPNAVAGDDSETTFVFTLPQRDIQEDDQVDRGPGSSGEDEDVEDYDSDEVDEIDVEAAEGEQGSHKESAIDISMQDATVLDIGATGPEKSKTNRKKKFRISKHGIQYPSLPAGVVKKLANTFARTGGNSKAKISKDTLEAIMQASDWFFEQVSDDLGAYAMHGGRKTIDESDVVTLMARQRQTNANTTPFALAQRHLPRELLQELRMVPPAKLKRGRHLERVDEGEED